VSGWGHQASGAAAATGAAAGAATVAAATAGVSLPRSAAPDRIAGVRDVPRDQFEELVADALDQIPPDLARLITNCVVLVEDDVPPGADPLLGLYEGTPLTERGSWYGGVLPDRITIYRLPILRICHTLDDVVEEVLVTVVHEIAHHFGIDDETLHELGWG
jgi:predicted Zn-dependent protease with MMP-like domain